MAQTLQNMPDGELLDVATQMIVAMGANPAAYGTTPADIGTLDSNKDTFNTDVTARVATDAADRAAVATKNASRRVLIDRMRGHRDTAKAAGATEAQMAATALPFGGEKVPANATTPVGSVDTSKRLRHTISWTEATTPDNKRRPRGAMGAEIFVKIDGAPPTDVSECTYLATDSATPYVAEYPGTDAGKMAHYMLRWRMRDGSTRAWGETVSATITG